MGDCDGGSDDDDVTHVEADIENITIIFGRVKSVNFLKLVCFNLRVSKDKVQVLSLTMWGSPRILVPVESTRSSPPQSTTATASLTAYNPYTCGQNDSKIFVRPSTSTCR